MKQIKDKATQEDNEAFAQTLKSIGMAEENIPRVMTLIDGMRKARKNRNENYRSDKIFVAGMAALNLILFQILASVSKPDFASYLAWGFFAVSLPSVGGFLYVSLLLEKNENYGYGSLHERIAGISVYSGAISAIALVWHFWMVAGIILLTTSLVMFFLTSLFRFFNDEDFTNAMNTIMSEIAAETPEKEN